MSRTLTRRTLTRRTLTRWVLVGLVLCLVVLGGASLLGLRLHPVVVPAAIAAILATWWRLADRARAERSGWSAPPRCISGRRAPNRKPRRSLAAARKP